MSHPDPRVAEALERTAAEMAAATTAPPPELTDDPAAYMRWLRTRPAIPREAQRPRAPRTYLDRSEVPRTWPRTRERPAQPSPHPAPGSVPELPDGYDTAVAILQRLADFGAASLEAARTEHPDWDYGDLVIHAAAHPVTPPAEPDDQTATDLLAAGRIEELPPGLCADCIGVAAGDEKPLPPVPGTCQHCGHDTNHGDTCAVCRQNLHSRWWATREAEAQ